MKILFTFSLLVISLNSMSSIICHTPRMNKSFEINNNKVTFFQKTNLNKFREIASVKSRNKTDINGINKIVDFENQKHIIHIEDVNHFSEINDYIVIKNQVGHEMTYPLNCNNY